MTLPAIGAIGGVLAQGVTGLGPSAAGAEPTSGAGASSSVGGLSELGNPLAPSEGVGGVSNAPAGVEGSGGGEPGGFGEALTQAISSLDQSQQSAAGAARALATGTAANPESAVVTVEDAQLAMQLASQIRTKATEATQQIFQTQV